MPIAPQPPMGVEVAGLASHRNLRLGRGFHGPNGGAGLPGSCKRAFPKCARHGCWNPAAAAWGPAPKISPQGPNWTCRPPTVTAPPSGVWTPTCLLAYFGPAGQSKCRTQRNIFFRGGGRRSTGGWRSGGFSRSGWNWAPAGRRATSPSAGCFFWRSISGFRRCGIGDVACQTRLGPPAWPSSRRSRFWAWPQPRLITPRRGTSISMPFPTARSPPWPGSFPARGRRLRRRRRQGRHRMEALCP